MKLLALVENVADPCCRYRVAPFASALQERGIRLEIVALASSVGGRVRQCLQAAQVDGVLLQRKLLPIWQLVFLRRRAKRLLYDVDDALFQRDSYHPKGPHCWRRSFRFWATVYAADAVLAGNRFLQKRVAQYIGPERVDRVPTCVDSGRYRMAEHHRVGGQVQLVWIGQASNLPSLNSIQGHLAEAARRVPGLTLRVICNQFPHLEGIPVLPYRWQADWETEALAEADIGICWLPPDVWSLGKCGLKVLQYMAAGLPVVANAVGIHRELILPGQTGFLVETPGQWAEAIEQLARNPSLRRQMGREARSRVKQHYDVNGWATRWADLVAGVLSAADWEKGQVIWEAQVVRSRGDWKGGAWAYGPVEVGRPNGPKPTDLDDWEWSDQRGEEAGNLIYTT